MSSDCELYIQVVLSWNHHVVLSEEVRRGLGSRREKWVY